MDECKVWSLRSIHILTVGKPFCTDYTIIISLKNYQSCFFTRDGAIWNRIPPGSLSLAILYKDFWSSHICISLNIEWLWWMITTKDITIWKWRVPGSLSLARLGWLTGPTPSFDEESLKFSAARRSLLAWSTSILSLSFAWVRSVTSLCALLNFWSESCSSALTDLLACSASSALASVFKTWINNVLVRSMIHLNKSLNSIYLFTIYWNHNGMVFPLGLWRYMGCISGSPGSPQRFFVCRFMLTNHYQI